MKDKKVMIVEALITDSKGRILLLKRSSLNKYYVGKWQLPGGKVEFGEDLQITVKNSGRWVNPGDETYGVSTGVGLGNLHDRLKGLYGPAYSLKKNVGQGTVEFELSLPVFKLEEDSDEN